MPELTADSTIMLLVKPPTVPYNYTALNIALGAEAEEPNGTLSLFTQQVQAVSEPNWTYCSRIQATYVAAGEQANKQELDVCVQSDMNKFDVKYVRVEMKQPFVVFDPYFYVGLRLTNPASNGTKLAIIENVGPTEMCIPFYDDQAGTVCVVPIFFSVCEYFKHQQQANRSSSWALYPGLSLWAKRRSVCSTFSHFHTGIHDQEALTVLTG